MWNWWSYPEKIKQNFTLFICIELFVALKLQKIKSSKFPLWKYLIIWLSEYIFNHFIHHHWIKYHHSLCPVKVIWGNFETIINTIGKLNTVCLVIDMKLQNQISVFGNSHNSFYYTFAFSKWPILMQNS